MIRRITKTLLIAALLAGIGHAGSSACQGWPFGLFESKPKEQVRTYQMSATKAQPSALDKVASGTKNFFNKTGETLGLKKKAPLPVPAVVAAKPPTIYPRYKESRPWYGFLMPEEKEAPKNVPSWMDQTKPVIP
jgi:hypothetical protein